MHTLYISITWTKSDWHGVTMRYETVINYCFVSISVYNLSHPSEKVSMLRGKYQRNMRNFWWFKSKKKKQSNFFLLQKSTLPRRLNTSCCFFFSFIPVTPGSTSYLHVCWMENRAYLPQAPESVTTFRITMLQFPLV